MQLQIAVCEVVRCCETNETLRMPASNIRFRKSPCHKPPEEDYTRGAMVQVSNVKLISAVWLFFATLLCCATTAVAQSLLIVDCQGFTRAVQKVDPGSLNKLEIDVTNAAGNPADGVQVSITNSATGEVSTAISNNGIAAFENLGAGTFSVSTASNVTVGAVTVGSMGASAAVAAGAAVGAGVAGGGAAAGVAVGVDEVASAVQGSNPDPTPTPEPTATPIPDPTIAPTPLPEPTPDCAVCDPDATPRPIDENDFTAGAKLSPSS